jgi:hypothetical protein
MSRQDWACPIFPFFSTSQQIFISFEFRLAGLVDPRAGQVPPLHFNQIFYLFFNL